MLTDQYFDLAAEHFGYQPGAPIATQDREVLALADFLRTKFGPLREALVQARLSMIGNREYCQGRALTHAGIDRCIEMADAALN